MTFFFRMRDFFGLRNAVLGGLIIAGLLMPAMYVSAQDAGPAGPDRRNGGTDSPQNLSNDLDPNNTSKDGQDEGLKQGQVDEMATPANSDSSKDKITEDDSAVDRSEAEIKLRDLTAQESMAKWTFWMVAVSLLQAVIGVAGIYFVRKTLRESIKATGAATEATKIAKLAERPWITLKPAIVSGLEIKNGIPRIGIEFALTSIGNTPADKVVVTGRFLPQFYDGEERLRKLIKGVTHRNASGGWPDTTEFGRTLFPREEIKKVKWLYPTKEEIADANTRHARALDPGVIGVVGYVSSTGGRHYTFFLARLTRNPATEADNKLLAELRDGVIAQEYLNLDVHHYGGQDD